MFSHIVSDLSSLFSKRKFWISQCIYILLTVSVFLLFGFTDVQLSVTSPDGLTQIFSSLAKHHILIMFLTLALSFLPIALCLFVYPPLYLTLSSGNSNAYLLALGISRRHLFFERFFLTLFFMVIQSFLIFSLTVLAYLAFIPTFRNIFFIKELCLLFLSVLFYLVCASSFMHALCFQKTQKSIARILLVYFCISSFPSLVLHGLYALSYRWHFDFEPISKVLSFFFPYRLIGSLSSFSTGSNWIWRDLLGNISVCLFWVVLLLSLGYWRFSKKNLAL